jgi:CelD/BcsL family acetyltransferase involved in cellulose biosynthesis
MSASFSTEEIRDGATLRALEPEWWALWRRAGATPFQAPAWLLPWWDAFAPGDLFAVAIRARGYLVGLAPFYVESSARGRRILPIGISVSDYLDILVDPDDADAVCRRLSVHLHTTDVAWDSWELTELSPHAAAARMPCPAYCDESADVSSACPVLVLPRSPEGLAAVLPHRRRRSLRMAQNRAGRRGAVEIIAADAASVDAMVAALIELHGARWQSRGEAGILADPRLRGFLAESIPRLLSAELLRLYALRIGGGLAGVYCGFLHGDRAYGYLTGFDPAFAFESPGAILVGHAIVQAIEEGAREFHFLRGRESYKYGWGAVDRFNRRRVFHKVPVHA